MFQVMCQVLSWSKSSTSLWLDLRMGWNQWFWIHLPCFNTPFLINGIHLTPTLKLVFISTLPLALFLSSVFLGEPWTNHPTPTPGFVIGNLFHLSWRPSNSSCLFKSLKINNSKNEASLLKTSLSPKRVARMEGGQSRVGGVKTKGEEVSCVHTTRPNVEAACNPARGTSIRIVCLSSLSLSWKISKI